MHTFFVNTAKRINTSQHEKLFDCLMLDSEIQILNYSIDSLNVCADKISETITRIDNINEDYNIIVYTEAENRNETALASERVAALVIEENLFARLYKLGRMPKQALIIFGENFTRNAEYILDESNEKSVMAAVWNAFPLPDAETVRGVFKAVRAEFERITAENLSEYTDKALTMLKEQQHDKMLIDFDSTIVKSTIDEMAESVKDNIESADFHRELYTALVNQNGYVCRRVTDEDVKYAHLRITDSDINAGKRTEVRLLLYVYYCAVNGSIDLLYLPDDADDDRSLVLGEESLPEVNWEYVASSLKNRRAVIKREKLLLQRQEMQFSKFNDTLINEKTIVKLSSDIPILEVHAAAHRGLTVKKLKESVKKTINEVESKCRSNDDIISSYITAVTDSFNIDKDSAMRGCEYKNDGDFIKNDSLTEAFIKKESDKIDAMISSHRRISPAAAHIDDIIKKSRDKEDYLFECLKLGKYVFFVGLAFILAFAIPHIITQWELSGAAYGAVFYLLSVALVLAAYTFGYLGFRRLFKKRIVKELDELCIDFGKAQSERQQLLEEYTSLLSKEIPLSYCLKLYSDEFNEYQRRKTGVSEHKTYHTRVLSEYDGYIENLLNELEISNLGSEEGLPDDYTGQLNVEDSKYHNSAVYSLIDRDEAGLCFKKVGIGGNR